MNNGLVFGTNRSSIREKLCDIALIAKKYKDLKKIIISEHKSETEKILYDAWEKELKDYLSGS